MLNIFLEHIFEGCGQEGISFGAGLERALSFGVRGLECDLWRLDEQVCDEIRESGMQVRSVYHMYDLGHGDADEIKRQYEHHIDTALKTGAKCIMPLPGFIEDGDDRERTQNLMLTRMSVICKAAVSAGLTPVLEDYDDSKAPYSTIRGLGYFLDNVQGLGCCFDTGNFFYSDEDETDALMQLAGYTKHVHLKDRSTDKTDGEEKDALSGRPMYPCAVGNGVIKIGDIVSALTDFGYMGDYSIEHFGAPRQFEYMKKSAEYVKGLGVS